MSNPFVKTLFIIALSAFVFVSCKKNKEMSQAYERTSGLLINNLPDTMIYLERPHGKVAVYIMPNQNLFSRGNILFLHGWNLSPLGWCEQTNLCNKLRYEGYNIIIPEMGKSMYASDVYKETMPTMRKFPQRSWINDTLLPYMAEYYDVFRKSSSNYLLGFSTGARGAMAIAQDEPDIFKAAVLISGDYDQTLMKDDNLMNFYYGDYESFSERWTGKDNLLRNISKLKMPVFVAHGQNDPVVPFIQSDSLVKALKKMNTVKVMFDFPKNQGHDFRFIDSEVDNIVNFLNKVQSPEL